MNFEKVTKTCTSQFKTQFMQVIINKINFIDRLNKTTRRPPKVPEKFFI